MDNRSKSGRTTRFVNNAVQRFFRLKKNETMLMVDHGYGKDDTIIFINIFDKRMKNEHPHENYKINYLNKTVTRL